MKWLTVNERNDKTPSPFYGLMRAIHTHHTHQHERLYVLQIKVLHLQGKNNLQIQFTMQR